MAQCKELADAGSELVRITVNMPESAATVAEIVARLRDLGCTAPIIGDFHYNGHVLLTKYPDCARALDKYRINPGNVGAGARRDEQFSTICKVAVDNGKPVRIGVNGGSLNQELVMRKMQENTDRDLGLDSEEIINNCMVQSAIESTELALECGLRHDQIIISCKVSKPQNLIKVYRDLSRKTEQPLHLGLTEAGMGTKGSRCGLPRRSEFCCRRASATRFAFRSRRAPAATAARKSTPPANSCSRSACARSRPA